MTVNLGSSDLPINLAMPSILDATPVLWMGAKFRWTWINAGRNDVSFHLAFVINEYNCTRILYSQRGYLLVDDLHLTIFADIVVGRHAFSTELKQSEVPLDFVPFAHILKKRYTLH